MANNIYIGMRYVPLFDGTYNSEKVYEPLTVVEYNNSSYTSKKQVPAGILPTNTEYWARSGDFNAQYNELDGRITTAQDTADDAATAAASAATAAASAQTTADSAATAATAAGTAADNAQDTADEALALATAAQPKSDMEAYVWYRRKGKNIVFIGDSWTVGTGATNPATERFSTRLSNALQMTEFNFGTGASGFTRPNTFLSQVNAASSSMTNEEKANTGIVCIVGGVNDLRNMSSTSLTDFETAISQTITTAHNVFPNALIVAAVPTTTNNAITDTMFNWIARATRIAGYTRSYPVLVINNPCNCINADENYYASDNLHPNTAGHATFAAMLANAIMGGGNRVFRYVGAIAGDGVTFAADPHLFRKDEFIYFNGMQINAIAEPITANTVIGTISPKFAPKGTTYFPFYSGNVVVGALAFTAAGSVRLIPNAGVTIGAGYASPAMWLAGQTTA